MANEKVVTERRDSVVIVIFKRPDQAGTRLLKMLTRLIERKCIYSALMILRDFFRDVWWTPSRVVQATMPTLIYML